MAETETLDVAALIDRRKLTGFNFRVGILCFFAIWAEGYDSTVIGFAGPYLVKAWGITNMAALGPVFSASLVGLIFGYIIFGYVGDRYGRRAAIVGSLLVAAVFTLATATASSVAQLLYLRLIAGIGMGGVIPNVLALNAEFAPRRCRATLVIAMFTGINFGSAMGGPVASAFVTPSTWPILFFVGGGMLLVMAAATWLWLPESIKYLVIAGKRGEAARVLEAMEGGHRVSPETNFILRDEKVDKSLSPKRLFAGHLRYLTPFLWLLYICNGLVYYFFGLWLPTILTIAHITPGHAALTTSLYGLGGVVGGYLICRPIDKFGMTPITVLFVLSVPIVAAVGFATGSEPLLMTLVFLSGVSIYGALYGMNASAMIIFPTAIRSNASGWTFTIARLSSIAGPIIGGFLVAAHATPQTIFILTSVPLGVGAVTSYVVARFFDRYYRGKGPAIEEDRRGGAENAGLAPAYGVLGRSEGDRNRE